MIIDLLKEEIYKLGLHYNSFSEIQNKDGIFVYRLSDGNKTAIIKYFEKEEFKRELICYQKLKDAHMQTIPLIGQTDNAIIMEDLSNSYKYRLANEEDLLEQSIIEALALWYKKLHSIKLTDEEKNNFYSEFKLLTKDNIEKIKKFDPENDAFSFFMTNEKYLVKQYYNYPICLNYNDFYYTNMIVAKDKSTALMFDYNLMGVGHSYNDLQNVLCQLNETMKKVFLEVYGDYNKGEELVNSWSSHLVTLIKASQRNNFPFWAENSFNLLKDGSILKSMKESLN